MQTCPVLDPASLAVARLTLKVPLPTNSSPRRQSIQLLPSMLRKLPTRGQNCLRHVVENATSQFLCRGTYFTGQPQLYLVSVPLWLTDIHSVHPQSILIS